MSPRWTEGWLLTAVLLLFATLVSTHTGDCCTDFVHQATCDAAGPNEDSVSGRQLVQLGTGVLHPFGVPIPTRQRNATLTSLAEVAVEAMREGGAGEEAIILETQQQKDGRVMANMASISHDHGESLSHQGAAFASLLQELSQGALQRSRGSPFMAIFVILIGVLLASGIFAAVFFWQQSASKLEEEPGDKRNTHSRGTIGVRGRSSSPGYAAYALRGPMSQFLGGGRRDSPRESLIGANTPSQLGGGPHQGLALQFCAGLVVPSGHECLLAVPVFRPRVGRARQPSSFEVRDLEGQELIQAEVPAWAAGGGSIGQSASVVLRSSSTSDSQPLAHLAHCKADLDVGGMPKAEFFNAHGQLFATMAKASPQQVQRLWPNQVHFSDTNMPSYVLTAAAGAGAQLLFSGNFDEHAVRVVNDRSEQLADTEPSQMRFDPAGSYYKLRVASNTDVGLVLCGLLLITQMETLWGRATA